MNTGATIWLIIFAVSAIVFFVIAAGVSIRGLADLRALLGQSEQVSRRRDGDQINNGE